ncbi:MAG TPA: hypothetical protein VF549_06000 [Solirubrobacteraceae bacterium]|jgi:hypothetical protein
MVHIWVRTDVPWEDEAAFAAQIPERMRPLVDLWNATFALPYHRFRAELRDIARESLAAVAGATVSEWDAIPAGALVLPVDDDDWFAPDAATVLSRERAAGDEGLRWTSTFLEVDIDLAHTLSKNVRRALPGVGQKWICTTNNYAVVKADGARTLCASHVAASRWVERDAPVRALERRLSVMNRTLASQTSLRRHRSPIDRPGLLRKRARYEALYERWERPPEDLAWTRPHVARMRALMARLG